jgi:transcriptional regulator with XRE-family HTH domain
MGKTTDLDKAFGIALRKLRLAKKLTQEQLGFEAGLRRTFISSLELGEKNPSLDTIFKLSFALSVPMSKLLKVVEKNINQISKNIDN